MTLSLYPSDFDLLARNLIFVSPNGLPWKEVDGDVPHHCTRICPPVRRTVDRDPEKFNCYCFGE